MDRQGQMVKNVFDIRDGFWVMKKRLQTVKVNGREEENLQKRALEKQRIFHFHVIIRNQKYMEE